ncbi:Sphingomyelin phosphodiesterase 3 [Larimichthys crocea]|uniref:Uncharacterized protein n=1 Tax=Larimichthys crocea TaxID=215358 RepID=A0ACD3QFB8_LARCR|nr:Sphingomyelin phosphodiesterase 3 [Larimichthys crocea]
MPTASIPVRAFVALACTRSNKKETVHHSLHADSLILLAALPADCRCSVRAGLNIFISAPPCIRVDASVRCEQLDWLLQWGAEFRQSSSQPPEGEKVLEDLVAFDVILGDLNFDNCSSEDKLEQQHALFTQYKDPCRLGPGEDKPWALGTLLDPSGLYDDEVSSPESLQKVMENEEGRKEYLVFPPSKSQCPASSQKGRKIPLKGNGRRIDYILYSDEGLQPDWKLEIEEFSFVTQLAGITDHLSVAMRLAVSTGEEEP